MAQCERYVASIAVSYGVIFPLLTFTSMFVYIQSTWTGEERGLYTRMDQMGHQHVFRIKSNKAFLWNRPYSHVESLNITGSLLYSHLTDAFFCVVTTLLRSENMDFWQCGSMSQLDHLTNQWTGVQPFKIKNCNILEILLSANHPMKCILRQCSELAALSLGFL